MDRERTRVVDPAAHQPSKAELEEEVSIDVTPESLGWVVTCGGAAKRDSEIDQRSST